MGSRDLLAWVLEICWCGFQRSVGVGSRDLLVWVLDICWCGF